MAHGNSSTQRKIHSLKGLIVKEKKELKHSTYTGKKKQVKNKPEAARKKTFLVSYSE